MIKKKITTIKNGIEDKLRSQLEKLTPKTRVVIVLIMFFLFAVCSIYITFSSFYNISKDKDRQIEIKRIERLKLPQQQTDSINQLKRFNYE